MGFLVAFFLLWVCWFGGFFNTEFSKMFKSSKVEKTRTKFFSYLTFRPDYQKTASAQQGRLRFTCIWLHRPSVPALANENSWTVHQPYVSVLTHCRWLLSFLTAEDKCFLYFLNILTSKDKVYFLRKVLERGKTHTSLPLETLEFVFRLRKLWNLDGIWVVNHVLF